MTQIRIDSTVLAAVAVAQSTDPDRYYLRGVCFDGADTVATDGKILTHAPDSATRDDNNEPIVYPVSKKAITALRRRNSTHAVFDGTTMSVYSKQGIPVYLEPCQAIDGTFPDWRRVIPEVSDGATGQGAFASALLSRIALTAKTLGEEKTVSVKLTGDDEHTAHLVRYRNGQILPTYSVIMPTNAKR